MKNRYYTILALAVLGLALGAIQSLAQSPYEPYTFTTLAGDAGYGSADGTATAARFHNPAGVAVDSVGSVYVADSGNNTIRKVTPSGVVTTLAGLAGNNGVAVDTVGNVYLADTGNGTLRKVTPAGVVTTLAGLAGENGSADGTGSAARFNQPHGVAVDSADNAHFTPHLRPISVIRVRRSNGSLAYCVCKCSHT
jgi:sugar lactone lactonase YvrE